MKSYDFFLRALEGSFEDFVKSDRVNSYLNTIGSEVKTQMLLNGIQTEFVIISGYEEERGSWATSYNQQIRFGDIIFPVEGLNQPIVLTPNLFYGKNQSGDEIEYRLGLNRDTHQLQVFPVVLKRDNQKLEGHILSDLCVIHRGIDIDSKTAQLLGRNVVELTTYQQFLTCFWNLDDYLRKQNPKFYSDYDIAIWQAVEVFSGRIIDQMLRRIADYFINNRNFNSVEWLIPQAEQIYWEGLLTWIERSLDEETVISKNQTLYLVKNLCSYICRFQNYEPLEVLSKRGKNILPFVLENFDSSNSEVLSEAQIVFEYATRTLDLFTKEDALKILEMLHAAELPLKTMIIFDLIIDKTPSIIEYAIQQIMTVINIPDHPERVLAFEAFKIFLSRTPEFINQDDFLQIMSFLSDHKPAISNVVIEVFKIVSKQIPQFTASSIPIILNTFQHKDQIARQAALEVYETLLINQTKLIHKLLPDIHKMFHNTIEYIRVSALKVYIKTLNYNPQLIDQTVVNNLIESLSDQIWDIRFIALKAIGLVIEKSPQFIPPIIPKIFDLCLSNNWDIKLISLKIYSLLLSNTPDLIDSTVISLILTHFSNSYQYIREAALEAYGTILYERSNLVDQEGINQIFKLLSDEVPDIRALALKYITFVISKLPHFISQNQINQFFLLLSDPDHQVRKAALLAYQQVLIKLDFLLTQESSQKILDLLLDQFWEVRMIALEVFETALRTSPQLTIGSLETLLNLLSTQHWDLKIITLRAFDVAFTSLPRSLNQQAFKKFLRLLDDNNKFVREAALGTLRIAISKNPSLINQKLIEKIKGMETDEDMLVQRAAKRALLTAQTKIQLNAPRM